MTNKELIALAERCEKATGPDAELDREIHIGVTTFEPRLGGVGWPEGVLVVPAFPGWKPLPAYTASLDAAMTLVPEGWPVRDLGDWTNAPGISPHWSVDLPDPDRRNCGAQGEAATAPLAICAAAIRARAQVKP